MGKPRTNRRGGKKSKPAAVPRKRPGGPLNVTNRVAKISGHANVRTEKHGNTDISACDITVSLGINKAELDRLLGAGAHERLYVKEPGVDAEPFFRGSEPMAFAAKIEGVDVTMRLGLARDELRLDDCKLAKISLKPETGGMTQVRVQIQAHPSDKQLGQLSNHLNMEIELDLKGGKRAQQEKPDKVDDDQPGLPLDPESAQAPATAAGDPIH